MNDLPTSVGESVELALLLVAIEVDGGMLAGSSAQVLLVGPAR